VVERLVANEKVASSTLVTRSSLRLTGRAQSAGWSECAGPAEGGPANQLRLTGHPIDALRLLAEVAV
jgi:hypothetical protein